MHWKTDVSVLGVIPSIYFCSEVFFFFFPTTCDSRWTQTTSKVMIFFCFFYHLKRSPKCWDEKKWTIWQCLINHLGLYHLPLLLQSFGVKWRHLGSMRRCLLCIALSCPSTMSSERVRMYWPCVQHKMTHFTDAPFSNYATSLQTVNVKWTAVKSAHTVLVSHLVVVDEVEVLQGWNDIFFLYTRDFTDLTGGFV